MLPRDHYLKQSFQDATHFPDGFEKGGLSDIQARLVRKNGILINALCIDEVSDPTKDDLHILRVISNQSAPKSPVEQAWIKYLSIVKAKSATISKPKATKAKSTKIAEEPTPEPIVIVPATPAAKPAKKAAAPKKVEAEIEVKKPTKKAVVEVAEPKASKPTKKVAAKPAAKATPEPKAETKAKTKVEPKKKAEAVPVAPKAKASKPTKTKA